MTSHELLRRADRYLLWFLILIIPVPPAGLCFGIAYLLTKQQAGDIAWQERVDLARQALIRHGLY